MTDEILKKANALRKERHAIERELKVWKHELYAPSQLAYKQRWNNDHAADLKTNIPKDCFMQFRALAMSLLAARMAEIDREFAAL